MGSAFSDVGPIVVVSRWAWRLVSEASGIPVCLAQEAAQQCGRAGEVSPHLVGRQVLIAGQNREHNPLVLIG